MHADKKQTVEQTDSNVLYLRRPTESAWVMINAYKSHIEHALICDCRRWTVRSASTKIVSMAL